jgi:hypothetical protein
MKHPTTLLLVLFLFCNLFSSSGSPSWPIEHSDSRNSGHSSSSLSPSQKQGNMCVTRPLSSIAPPSVFFTSSGVTTSDGRLHIVGASNNHLYCSHTTTPGAGSSRSIDIRQLFTSDSFNLPPPLPSSYGVGIEVSPATGRSLKDGLDRIYVASSDGNLYTLLLLDGGDCGSFRPDFFVNFSDPLESAPRLFPDMNPERIITSTSGDGTDSNGVLHCIDANTGSILWSRPAQCCSDDIIYSLKGIAPVIDPLGKGSDHAVIIAFAYHILAIDIYTGKEITSLSLPNHSGPRRFVGSPTYARDGSSIFISAATSGSSGNDGWIFKINTAGDGVDNKMTLKIAASHSLNTCSKSKEVEAPHKMQRKRKSFRRNRSIPLTDDEIDYTTSSPSLTQDGSVLVSSQISSTSSALFRYPAGGGTSSTCEWYIDRVQGILSNGSSSQISIGTLRSAAAVDSSGLAYISALDSLNGAPLLLVLDAIGDLQVVIPILDSTKSNLEPPPSRPLLIDDGEGSKIIVGLGSGPALITSGSSCPTNILSLQCSGHGSCNCNKGSCLCFDGYSGDDCSINSLPSPTASPSTSSLAPPPSPSFGPDSNSNGSNTNSSPGEIAGITVGAIALLLISTIAVFRKRLLEQWIVVDITRRAEKQSLLSKSNTLSEVSMSSRLSMLKVSSSSSSPSSKAAISINE